MRTRLTGRVGAGILGTFAMLIAGAVTAACGDHVTTVSVRELSQMLEVYEGRRIRTEGVLRQFSPGTADEHIVVEQDGQFRVGLRGVASEDVAPLLSRTVRVEGVLRFDPGFGVYIEAAKLVPSP